MDLDKFKDNISIIKESVSGEFSDIKNNSEITEAVEDYIIEESYMIGHIEDLDKIYDLGRYELYGSQKFNNNILNNLIDNSNIMRMFEGDIKNAFTTANGCYFTVFDKSKLAFIFNKFKNKILDIMTFIDENHIIGFYAPGEDKLFILLNNTSSIMSNINDDKVSMVVIHELTHKAANKSNDDFYNDNSNIIHAFYKNLLYNSINFCLTIVNPNISEYKVKYIQEINTQVDMVKVLDAIEKTIREDKDIQDNIEKISKFMIENESRNYDNMSQYKRMMNQVILEWSSLIDTVREALNKKSADINIDSENLNKLSKQLNSILTVPLTMYLYSPSSDKLYDYIMYSSYGTAFYSAMFHSYVALADEFNYNRGGLKSLNSFFIQEMFIPSEIVCISNTTFLQNRSKYISNVFKMISK